MRDDIHTKLFRESFTYLNVPELTQDGLWNYMAYGLEPGSFLISVLKNDFYMATMLADSTWSGATFKDLARWIVKHVPADMRGSDQNVYNWISSTRTDKERCERMIELNLRPNEFDVLRGI